MAVEDSLAVGTAILDCTQSIDGGAKRARPVVMYRAFLVQMQLVEMSRPTVRAGLSWLPVIAFDSFDGVWFVAGMRTYERVGSLAAGVGRRSGTCLSHMDHTARSTGFQAR